MYNKILIMTVGLPRSGKSTWARKTGFPIVCPDAIRLALHGQRRCPEAEQMVWTVARYMVKALFLAGHDRVILDSTMSRRHHRRLWCDGEWEVQVNIFDTDADTCKARAVASGQCDLISVIDAMGENFAEVENRAELREFYRQYQEK